MALLKVPETNFCAIVVSPDFKFLLAMLKTGSTPGVAQYFTIFPRKLSNIEGCKMIIK